MVYGAVSTLAAKAVPGWLYSGLLVPVTVRKYLSLLRATLHDNSLPGLHILYMTYQGRPLSCPYAAVCCNKVQPDLLMTIMFLWHFTI